MEARGFVPGPYRSVLAAPGAARMFASALLARLPQGMSSLATLLLVRASTHSYAAAGIATGAQALATATAAPVLGRVIDRVGRARVLMRCALAYAVAISALVIAAQLRAGAVVLVLASGLVGACLPPIAPALRSLLRQVFPETDARERAYALESVAQELVWIVGPVIVGVVVTVISPAAALELVGVVCVLGSLLFVRVPLIARAVPERREHAPSPALASRSLRFLLVPIALTGLALGSTEVGLPALALHAGSRAAAGLLLALWSVGSMAGGLWVGSRAWRMSLSLRYCVLLVAAVACTAPLIVAHSLALGALFSVMSGLMIAPVFSCQYALVGHTATPGTETEAFTWVASALVAGLAAGQALGGALVSGAGYSTAFVLTCAAMAVSAASAVAAHTSGVYRTVGQAA